MALDVMLLSINLLTLLALVLAIGLVVDDAIVVLENVQRRVDLGEPPLVAASRGTRQVAFAVMATTAVLIAVFVPIMFLQGTSGALFSELAIALASAVGFSALVALTLSPMMCSKLLKLSQASGACPAHRCIVRARAHAYLDALDLASRGRARSRHLGRGVVAGVALWRLIPASSRRRRIAATSTSPSSGRRARASIIPSARSTRWSAC